MPFVFRLAQNAYAPNEMGHEGLILKSLVPTKSSKKTCGDWRSEISLLRASFGFRVNTESLVVSDEKEADELAPSLIKRTEFTLVKTTPALKPRLECESAGQVSLPFSHEALPLEESSFQLLLSVYAIFVRQSREIESWDEERKARDIAKRRGPMPSQGVVLIWPFYTQHKEKKMGFCDGPGGKPLLPESGKGRPWVSFCRTRPGAQGQRSTFRQVEATAEGHTWYDLALLVVQSFRFLSCAQKALVAYKFGLNVHASVDSLNELSESLFQIPRRDGPLTTAKLSALKLVKCHPQAFSRLCRCSAKELQAMVKGARGQDYPGALLSCVLNSIVQKETSHSTTVYVKHDCFLISRDARSPEPAHQHIFNESLRKMFLDFQPSTADLDESEEAFLLTPSAGPADDTELAPIQCQVKQLQRIFSIQAQEETRQAASGGIPFLLKQTSACAQYTHASSAATTAQILSKAVRELYHEIENGEAFVKVDMYSSNYADMLQCLRLALENSCKLTDVSSRTVSDPMFLTGKGLVCYQLLPSSHRRSLSQIQPPTDTLDNLIAASFFGQLPGLLLPSPGGDSHLPSQKRAKAVSARRSVQDNASKKRRLAATP
jgi:hypothetical protein